MRLEVRVVGGRLPLGLGPLEDAELVLLVHDHQAQPRERHVLLDQGVRADDDVGVAVADAAEDLLAARPPACRRPAGPT